MAKYFGTGRGRIYQCPNCLSSPIIVDLFRAVEVAEVSWDHASKQFIVTATFRLCCDRCDYEWQEVDIVKRIPLLIAEVSACDCGSRLSLRSHALRRKADSVEFEAEYVCEACEARRETVLRRIVESLSTLWKKTRKIEVGVNGVSYEKDGE